MRFSEAIQEFGFDCRARKLSDKTISNYQKQLRYWKRISPSFRSIRAPHPRIPSCDPARKNNPNHLVRIVFASSALHPFTAPPVIPST